jgi:hypothetical protein
VPSAPSRGGDPLGDYVAYQLAYGGRLAEHALATGTGLGLLALCGITGLGCREIGEGMVAEIGAVVADPGAAVEAVVGGLEGWGRDYLGGDPGARGRAAADLHFTVVLAVVPTGAATKAGKVVRAPTSGPGPLEALQHLADDVIARIGSNGRWLEKLSRDERAALRANPERLGPMLFGSAVQRALNDRVARTPGLVKVQRPNRWDYQGMGAWSGHLFELTTETGVARHAGRWYGTLVDYVTYARPANYLDALGR